ncbi:MAG: tetratricopeptide repeat protein, partial [Gammaproteobacteria bacterium]
MSTPIKPPVYAFNFSKAIEYARAGKSSLAYQQINKAIKKDPLNLDYLIFRASISYQMGLYQESEQYFKALLKTHPKVPEVYNGMGVLYQSKNFELAENYFLEALKLNPAYTNAIANLADLYYANNQFEKACQYYEKLLDTAFKAEVIEKLLLIYERNNEIQKAIKILESYKNSVNPEFFYSKKL